MHRIEGRAAVYDVILNNLQDAEEQEQNPPMQMLKGLDPFALEDSKFVKLFRLDKDRTYNLIDMLEPHLQAPTRASALSIQTKVLASLRFLGTGSYQEITGSNIFTAISQPSVSRCLTEVTDALNQPNILNEWVKFPQNIHEMEDIRGRFYEKYRFPGVIGLIDCTHVAIVAPSGPEYPEYVYVNRKNYHSINVQLICDENLKILNVDARFPGSSNDIYIWKQSPVSQIMETLYRQNPNNLFYLLGDSGYTLRPWLMTPMDTPPANAAEERFDNTLKRVRSGIERCNGMLKNRFRCLLKHRVLHYKPSRASKIVNACAVLHNMCIDGNIPEPVVDYPVENVDFGMDIQPLLHPRPAAVNADLAVARRMQRQISATHFIE